MDGEGLTELVAFQAFQRALGDRLTAGPTPEDATLVGSYPGAVVGADD